MSGTITEQVSHLLVVVLVLAAGCSKSRTHPGFDAGGADAGLPDAADASAVDAGPPRSPLEQFLTEASALRCEIALRCENRAGFAWLGLPTADLREAPHDPIVCHPSYRDRYDRDLVQAVEEGRTVFNERAAAACLDGYRSFHGCPVNLHLLDSSLPPPLEACGEVFTGLLPTGASCLATFAGFECGQRSVCWPSASPCPFCRRLGLEGDACAADDECAVHLCVDDVCRGLAQGEACEEGSTPWCASELRCRDGMCQPRGEVGDPCLRHPDCLGTLLCGADGTCREPPSLIGERCDGIREINPCRAAGLYCVESEGVWRCATDPEGSLCYGPDVPATCPADLVYSMPDGTLDCRCVRGRAAGETCDAGTPCGLDLRCVDGRCIRIALPGMPCGPDVVCPPTHYCDGNCRALPTAGEDCFASGICFEGLCVGRTCTLMLEGAACGAEGLPYRVCEGPCLAPTCGPLRRGENAPCELDEHCAEGLECLWNAPMFRCTSACG